MQKISGWVAALALVAGWVMPLGAQYGPGYGPPGPPPRGGDWSYNGGDPGRWNPAWNGRPNPRRGACFYTDRGFRGNHFCVQAGDRIPRLPGDIGDNISSVQTFGGARVRVFDDRNFQGMNAVLPGTIGDLSRVPSRPGHTWNNRISSVMVM